MQKLKFNDAETLLATPLPKTMYLVDRLLPQGLSVFCGASKIGKSWFMLDLALHIASGKPLWGLGVQRSDVLYLSLEDTEIRLQERLYQITDEAPSTLRYATACEKIGKGLEQQIVDFLREFPQTKLVIIDTLQKVRNVGSPNVRDGMYAVDYSDISALKALADRHGIAIIFVHHLRKMADVNDPFNDVSGTAGIVGAADTTFILRRRRNEQSAELLVTGRDVEYQEITLKFFNLKWELVERKNEEEIKKEKIPDFMFRLVDFLDGRSEWRGTATQLLAAMNDAQTPNNVITKYLGRYALEVLSPKGIIYNFGKLGSSRFLHFRCEEVTQ